MLNRSFSLTGGVPRVLLTYARNCDKDRVRLHMASFKPFAPSMADAVEQTGTAIHTIGDRGYLRPALALRKILARERIDVVVATSLKSYLIAKLAATRRCRTAYWIHGIALVTENRLKSAVYRRAARRDTLIFISGLVEKAHNYAGHAGRAEVVLNGVEDFLVFNSLYDRTQRDVLGIPKNAMLVGYTAAFIAWKEHKTLLAAFSRLAKDHPEMHLALIGTGELWRLFKNKHVRFRAANESTSWDYGPMPDSCSASWTSMFSPATARESASRSLRPCWLGGPSSCRMQGPCRT